MPPPQFSYGFLSSADLNFLNLAGFSALALMIVYCIYTCYERKYSNINRMPDIERGRQSPPPPPPPPPASSGRHQPTPSTVVICTKLFQYGVGGIDQAKNTDCSICLDEFAEGEVCRMLPKCKHIFHRFCIDPWLRRERHCPLCRSAVHLRRTIFPNRYS